MGISNRFIIGMDCGTTNIKAVILGEDGQTYAEASKPSHFLKPGPLMQEQDANEWWDNAKEIFQSLVRQAGDDVAKKICGISVSSHTVSLLPVDEKGVPIRNALTYQDGRSYEELKYIVDKMGFDHFVETVGGQPSVAFLPNKLLWYKEHEPENFARTCCFLQASSFINFKLTGKMTSDLDQATRTQCLDMHTMEWSDEIGKIIGIDLKKYLPEPMLIDQVIGSVTEEAAAETGLKAGTPVIAGCSDAMASMLATGISQIGEAGESAGTTSLVFVGSRHKSAMNIPVVTRPCAIDGMPWVFDAPIQTSGAAIRWFIDLFAGEEVRYCKEHGRDIYGYLNERALQAPAGSDGVIFYPYLLGERAPLWNDYAKGMFIGMTMDTTRDDLIRSLFEGLSFALRHVITTIKESGGEVTSLRICGGGAKNRTGSMIKASMLHCPVHILDENSGDVPVGDALLVGHKMGVFPDLTEAVKTIVKIKETIYPVPEWEEKYDKMYPYYVQFYRDLDADLKTYKTI